LIVVSNDSPEAALEWKHLILSNDKNDATIKSRAEKVHFVTALGTNFSKKTGLGRTTDEDRGLDYNVQRAVIVAKADGKVKLVQVDEDASKITNTCAISILNKL
jgi:peroxiredoxin